MTPYLTTFVNCKLQVIFMEDCSLNTCAQQLLNLFLHRIKHCLNLRNSLKFGAKVMNESDTFKD